MYGLKSLFIVGFSIAFFLSGCQNDDIVTPIQQKDLSKIIQDAENYTTFDYLNGKLVMSVNVSESQVFTSVTLSYKGNVRPQSEVYITRSEEYLKEYFYNVSFLLDSMIFSHKDNANNYIFEGRMKYYYNESDQLSKMDQYNTAGNLLYTTEYKYDSVGNIIERRFYYSNVLNEITTMTYDNKINPWYGLKEWLNYEASLSKNNLLSISTVYPNNVQNNSETIFTYKYDSDGYPTSRTNEYTVNNVKTIRNYTYEYQ